MLYFGISRNVRLSVYPVYNSVSDLLICQNNFNKLFDRQKKKCWEAYLYNIHVYARNRLKFIFKPVGGVESTPPYIYGWN